ncbi:MAG TPA: YdcF family protein, partial [Polyangiaceae bacterium]|nr:YdcF family protein [Polyangiaceae bacterium]
GGRRRAAARGAPPGAPGGAGRPRRAPAGPAGPGAGGAGVLFYLLSKTLDVVLEPLAWALALGALGARRLRGPPAHAAWASLALLYAFSVPAVADLLWRALEAGTASTYRREGEPYDAAILLGGPADNNARDLPEAFAYNENVERVHATFELLRSGRARAAVVSSGPIEPAGRAPSEAHLLAEQLERWGVAPERLVVEPRSRNTAENARETAALVRARGFRRLVLVTSAYHMPRALGCFRAVGLEVDALPVDSRAPVDLGRSPLPRADSLARSTTALREFAGRLIYRARGFSKP